MRRGIVFTPDRTYLFHHSRPYWSSAVLNERHNPPVNKAGDGIGKRTQYPS
jgi:hypothetical protein